MSAEKERVAYEERLREERDAAEVRREQAESARNEWKERSELVDQQLGNLAVDISHLEELAKEGKGLGADAKYWEDRALTAESQVIELEEKENERHRAMKEAPG